MQFKKYALCVGVAAVVLSSAVSLALAEDMMGPKNPENISLKASTMMQVGKEMAMRAGTEVVLQVNRQGKALLRGTVDTVGTNSLTVKSWGGNWVVNIVADTKLFPNSDMSQFKLGDLVGVQGTVSETLPWTIDAVIVRDWSARKLEQTTKQEVNDLMKSVTPRNWQGTATVSGSTLTLAIDGVTYMVTVTGDAKIVNQQYAPIALSDVKTGDTVRIYATISGTTATAYVLRDISLGGKPDSENH